MEITLPCPNCKELLAITANDDLIRKDLAKLEDWTEKERADLLEKANYCAKDFSEEGDAKVEIWKKYYTQQDYLAERIVDRMIEYSFVVKNVLEYKPKKVLDIGSFATVLPNIISALGCQVTASDAQEFDYSFEGIKFVKCDLSDDVSPLRKSYYDMITCISSVEHFGLGRFGDRLDKDGDFKGMEHLRKSLKIGGKLILTLPIGLPIVCFPGNRIYNPSRLAKLVKGFRVLKEDVKITTKENGKFAYKDVVEKIDWASYKDEFVPVLGCYVLEKI